MEYQHIEEYYYYYNEHAKEGFELYKDDINDTFSAVDDVYDKLLKNNKKINKKDFQKAFEAELFHKHLPHDVYDLAVESLEHMIRLIERS
ncbi:hypothetical protein [Mycoplasma sp. P36-A1]|uniref:hypothetical protein n=1 Tax=Mycoplasma sp. P36-A1 TaxID=3252900 RepID=UPI003C30B714